ncbi:MAG: ATP-binding protein [Oscillospiraceae bacterium]|nr:ATP-binding protein [Oscillospiraceae bacterium]
MVNSAVYSKALDIINNRRLTAKSENNRRFSEIEENIPEIREINGLLAKTSVELIKIISSGQNVQGQVQELGKKNQQAQMMISQILMAHGYPHNYLDMKYTCPKCSDTGFMNGERCECLNALIGKLAVTELNSHSQIKLCSFDTFDLTYYKNIQTPEDNDCYRTMSVSFEHCKKYAETFSLKSPNILMAGKTGLGKTHLSLSIAEKLLQKGWNVLYDSAINYLMQIEKEHFGKTSDNTDTLQILLDTDLLILDDLGSEYETSFYTSTIYNIINTRLNKSLPTIISTNLTPIELEKRYDQRIVSRLFTMYQYLKFTGKDVRAIKAAANSRQTLDFYKADK